MDVDKMGTKLLRRHDAVWLMLIHQAYPSVQSDAGKEWKHGKGTAVFCWEGYLFRGLAHSTVNSTRPFPYVDCIQTGFRMGPWVFNWPSVSMHRHAQEQEGARQQKHPSGLVGLGLGQLNAVDWCWLYYSYTMLYLDVFSPYMSLHVFTHLSAEAP